MADRIGVIDYGGGNLQNVLNVLKFLGREGTLVSTPSDLDSVDRLLFPGVGSFGDCVEDLDR
ncbi:imidazole glycerol phosphate synthase subunit HisH, partial [Verrucomicrobiales bacterium]|nr:imidazole glycerol phosphate synthase subunit HisH [Verrucomicrobiales bacterium]